MFAAVVLDAGASTVGRTGASAPRRRERLVAAARDCEAAVRGHLVLLGGLTAVSVAGTVAAPALWHQPVLLMALAPRLPFLVLAAATVPLPVFLVVGTVRLCVADPVHFDLARRLGDRVEPLLPGWGRVARTALAGRWGRPATAVWVVLRPTSNQLRLAAWSGLRAHQALVLSALGTVAYLVALHLGTGRLT